MLDLSTGFHHSGYRGAERLRGPVRVKYKLCSSRCFMRYMFVTVAATESVMFSALVAFCYAVKGGVITQFCICHCPQLYLYIDGHFYLFFFYTVI